MHGRHILGMVLVVMTAGCRMEDPSDRIQEHADGPAVRTDAGAAPAGDAVTSSITPVTQARIERLRSTNGFDPDTIDSRLRRFRMLTRWEQVKLRRDVNARQIARARQLGISPSSDFQGLVNAGKLVELPASTQLWTTYNLSYSVPFVTPSTEAMLFEIGERFQARLDSADIPPYRLVITSVLRTSEKQAELRRRNSNASKIESAHEFGTTMDLAYRRFAPPLVGAESGDAMTSGFMRDSLLAETAKKRSGELQAVLGRVLQAMQDEGKVMVMMERRQTVYHITVAKAYPPRTPAPSR